MGCVQGCIHRVHHVRPGAAHQVDGLFGDGIGSCSRVHADDLGDVAHTAKEGPRQLAGPAHLKKLYACLVKASKAAACFTVFSMACSLFQCLSVHLHTARQRLAQLSKESADCVSITDCEGMLTHLSLQVVGLICLELRLLLVQLLLQHSQLGF